MNEQIMIFFLSKAIFKLSKSLKFCESVQQHFDICLDLDGLFLEELHTILEELNFLLDEVKCLGMGQLQEESKANTDQDFRDIGPVEKLEINN